MQRRKKRCLFLFVVKKIGNVYLSGQDSSGMGLPVERSQVFLSLSEIKQALAKHSCVFEWERCHQKPCLSGRKQAEIKGTFPTLSTSRGMQPVTSALSLRRGYLVCGRACASEGFGNSVQRVKTSSLSPSSSTIARSRSRLRWKRATTNSSAPSQAMTS